MIIRTWKTFFFIFLFVMFDVQAEDSTCLQVGQCNESSPIVLEKNVMANKLLSQKNRWIEVEHGAWKLNHATLHEIQSKLVDFVENGDANPTSSVNASTQKIPGLSAKWGSYTVQYQGQHKDGKNIVHINAACEVAKGVSLKKEFYVVFDGGPCYFQLSYDPVKKRFFDLWVNGRG